ncbi:hypothetical protein FNH08_09265 [Streptomyces spongiae]|uniref:Uncharacterized protein n=1 Tax=Streptomyces spongiae TaxID=565072 RepID=A0A5N8XD20_9ACTN|nr:hypothetical protein [Streptomyces spongiae]
MIHTVLRTITSLPEPRSPGTSAPSSRPCRRDIRGEDRSASCGPSPSPVRPSGRRITPGGPRIPAMTCAIRHRRTIGAQITSSLIAYDSSSLCQAAFVTGGMGS